MTHHVDIVAAVEGLRAPAPNRVKEQALVETGVADGYTRRDGPLGPVFVAFNSRGISLVEAATTKRSFERDFSDRFGRHLFAIEPERSLDRGLDAALASGVPGDLRFDLRGLGPFATAVLRATVRIPVGEVRSYSWVAAVAGNPRAVRAAGSALARNPIALLIPCHRVVRSDGLIGEYGMGGPENKWRILTQEGVDVERLGDLARRGGRYVASTTGVFCHPTCRHARRLSARHQLLFPDAATAQAAGMRPCTWCEPVAGST